MVKSMLMKIFNSPYNCGNIQQYINDKISTKNDKRENVGHDEIIHE